MRIYSTFSAPFNHCRLAYSKWPNFLFIQANSWLAGMSRYGFRVTRLTAAAINAQVITRPFSSAICQSSKTKSLKPFLSKTVTIQLRAMSQYGTVKQHQLSENLVIFCCTKDSNESILKRKLETGIFFIIKSPVATIQTVVDPQYLQHRHPTPNTFLCVSSHE